MRTRLLLPILIGVVPLLLPTSGGAATLAELLEPGTVLRVLSDTRLPMKRGTGRPMRGYLAGGPGRHVRPAPGGVMTGYGTNATDRELLTANGGQLPGASVRPDAPEARSANVRDLLGDL